jgi:cell division protein FtsB
MRIKRPATAVVFVVLLALFIILLAPRVLQNQTLSARSEKLEKELNDLKVRNKRLELELRLLRSDPLYLEKVARQKFNKAKQGEIVYKVVREGKNTRSASPSGSS